MKAEEARFGGGRAAGGALAGGGAALALFAVGAAAEPRQAAFSYLAAFAFCLSLALGALVFLMIQHAIGASWFVALRRIVELFVETIPALALLFLPLLAWRGELYPGTGEAAAGFSLLRSAAYFALWIPVGHLLVRWTLRQGEGEAALWARRQRVLAAGALPAVGLAFTFAAFDWVMALTPAWYSTVFGVYVFVGGALGALGLLALAAGRLGRGGPLAGVVTVSHTHAVGKLLLTFVCLWAYIAFVQYFLIWIADLPGEAIWLAPRSRGSWAVVGWMLIVGHFALPFLLLLSRDLKRRPGVLAALGAWLVAMHYVDVYWLVLPTLHPDGARPHWLDLAALVGVGGACAAYGLWRGRGTPAVASADPRFQRSLAFHTS